MPWWAWLLVAVGWLISLGAVSIYAAGLAVRADHRWDDGP